MKRISYLIIMLAFPVILSAQLTPVTNQYVLNPFTINPSYAGGREALNMAAYYRRQWLGIEGAPQTITLAIDAPILSSKLGLGLMVVNDKIGVTKQTQFMTAYAYRINFDEGFLSFGIGGGVLTTNTAWSNLVVIDPGDEYYLIDTKTFVVPDFSFGTYLSYKKYFVGFSIPRLLAYRFNFNRNKYSINFEPENYSFILNSGYLIDIKPNIRFLPSILISYSPGDRLLYDINAHFNMFDRFWIGASYRSTGSYTGLFQFDVNKQFKVAYSYDFNAGELSSYGSGSHEIMLRYEFSYKVDAVNPLIF
jgi:type IX secretion system PorP/SprF family membrane protein